MKTALLLLVTAGLAGAADVRDAVADGGFYSEADLGATFFAGQDGSDAGPGPSFGARLGYGPLSWLYIGGLGVASTHEATVGPSPAGQYFQLYRVGGELRLAGRIGPVGLFLAPDAGYSFLSSNVLGDAGVTKDGAKNALFFGGSGGFEWHTQNPRFAFGLAGEADVIPNFNLTAISVQLYIRYTKHIW